MYIKNNNNDNKTSTRLKSQFALKVDFIESKTLDIAWDLCDFHKWLVCHVNLIYSITVIYGMVLKLCPTILFT